MSRKSRTMRPPRRSPSAKEDALRLLRSMVEAWLKGPDGPIEAFGPGLDPEAAVNGFVALINKGYLAVQVVEGDLASGDFEYTIVKTPKGERMFGVLDAPRANSSEVSRVHGANSGEG